MKLKLGKYQHFKTKNLYNVIAVAKHSETLEEFVVYEALYRNPRSKLWIRPLKMFLEKVEVNDKKVPRFKFIEDSKTNEDPERSRRIDEQKQKNEEGFFVYILRTSANTLYTGQTNNLEKRMMEHKSKSSRSAKYVRNFDSFELVYSEKHATRKSAMTREAFIKTWTKKRKEKLIKTECDKL